MQRFRVWDLPIRAFHWSLALSALSLMAATLVLLSYALRHHQGVQA